MRWLENYATPGTVNVLVAAKRLVHSPLTCLYQLVLVESWFTQLLVDFVIPRLALVFRLHAADNGVHGALVSCISEPATALPISVSVRELPLRLT